MDLATKDYVLKMIKTMGGGGGGADATILSLAQRYADQQALAALNAANANTIQAVNTASNACNRYADEQAAAAMNEANTTTENYVTGRFEAIDVNFQNVAITTYWDTGDIYYVDVARPQALANKHIVSTMIVSSYGGSPMGVYTTGPADTSTIRFTSKEAVTIHATVRFFIINYSEGE